MADLWAELRSIERLFPLIQSAAYPPADGEDDDVDENKIEARLLEIQGAMTWVKPLPLADGDDGNNIRRPGSLHQRYETLDDLSGPAQGFHDRAAKLSGLSTADLLRAVFRLEQLLIYWTDHVKNGSVEEIDREAESVLSRPLARILGVKQVW